MISPNKISPDEARRLAKAGFRYYSFISYPNTDDSLRRFATQFHFGLESILSQNLPPCHSGSEEKRAFLDSACIEFGSVWENELGLAICKSITMVALCVPMYAHPKHSWCGREWAAMKRLGQKRLPNGPDSIFVVRLGELPLHEEIARLEVFDLSKRHLQWLSRTADFQDCLTAALHHTVKVSRALLDSDSDSASGPGSDCRDYRLPDFSEFAPAPTPPIPNRQDSGAAGGAEEST